MTIKYYYDYCKSKCNIVSRDCDIVFAKIVKSKKSVSFFSIGGGVCAKVSYLMRGFILELSVVFTKILLLDIAKDIKIKSILYPCSKVLGVDKNIPGTVYTGTGLPVGCFSKFYLN